MKWSVYIVSIVGVDEASVMAKYISVIEYIKTSYSTYSSVTVAYINSTYFRYTSVVIIIYRYIFYLYN